MSYSKRVLSFLMAAVSFNKRVIGDAAKVLNAIPVMRPEDYKVKGKGKVKFVNSKEIMVKRK
jgi:hypothetical protein